MRKIYIEILFVILLVLLVACTNENNVNIKDLNFDNGIKDEIIINKEEENIDKKQYLYDLEINYELKEENKIEEDFEYTRYEKTNKYRKIIEYSFEVENEIVYLGRLEKNNSEYPEMIHFLEYNGKMIDFYIDYVTVDRQKVWKDFVFVIDLDESDLHKEIVIWKLEDPIEYSTLEFYRIIDDQIISMGKMEHRGFYKADNKLYNYYSDIFWIEEEVITNYYEIKENKIIHTYKFLDGRNSFTTEEQEADLSELIKNEYTINYDDWPIINLESWDDNEWMYKEVLKNGTKIKIIELKSLFTVSAKIEKENGESIIINEKRPGMT